MKNHVSYSRPTGNQDWRERVKASVGDMKRLKVKLVCTCIWNSIKFATINVCSSSCRLFFKIRALRRNALCYHIYVNFLEMCGQHIHTRTYEPAFDANDKTCLNAHFHTIFWITIAIDQLQPVTVIHSHNGGVQWVWNLCIRVNI